MSKRFLFKILTVGDGSVGKTTLLQRYIGGFFEANPHMTIGVNFYLKRLFLNSVDVTLQLWDFGGQARFRFLLKKYVGGASGAFLLYDLSNPSTLESAEEWVDLVRMENKSLPILLVGTKYDLIDLEKIDDKESNIVMAKFRMIANIKTSSKTGLNIEDIFEILVKELLNRQKSKNY